MPFCNPNISVEKKSGNVTPLKQSLTNTGANKKHLKRSVYISYFSETIFDVLMFMPEDLKNNCTIARFFHQWDVQ